MQDIAIIPIDCSALTKMQNIFSRSAGYKVSIEDELQYFDPNRSVGWVLAKNKQNQILGFIRHLRQSSDWSLAEFYVDSNIQNRIAIAHNLIAEFKKKAQFQSGHRLRFDILKIDTELNEVIKAEGFSHKVQLFKHFQQSVGDSILQDYKSFDSKTNICETVECLCHLNPVSESEVHTWIANDQIRIIIENFRVAAAAQIFINEDFIEINRIASHPLILRQGNAERLIQMIYTEAVLKKKKLIYLKVEDIREPAIALYKKSGFVEIEDKAQLWHSFWY